MFLLIYFLISKTVRTNAAYCFLEIYMYMYYYLVLKQISKAKRTYINIHCIRLKYLHL